MRTDKLEQVQIVLKDGRMADWYKTEHGVTVDILTVENVNTYGTGSYGDIADLIIQDGIENGIITE